MNCSSLELKAYVLEELDSAGRGQIEEHAALCASCREEIARLRLTRDALGALPTEEVPRRIAFISDKIFETRWWQAFLRPGFVGACVLAAAILVHALARPVPEAVIQARVDEAVRRAVAESEARQVDLLANAAANYELLYKQVTRMYVAANRMEVRQ